MKPGPVTSSSIPTSTRAVTGPVTVDIDELVLVGFDRASAAELAGEIRKALTRALAEQGPPAWWTDAGHPYMNHPSNEDRYVAHLDVSIRATDSPATIAETLATQLFAGTTTRRGGQP